MARFIARFITGFIAQFRMASFLIVLGMLSIGSLHASSEQPAVPLHSHLVNVNDHQLHIHQKGKATESPLLILLSGPTDNWHSDSAWWLLAQNYLSDDFQTMSIDRAGQGWSSRIEKPSYRQFADDLRQLLLDDDFISQQRELVFLAFASSNLSLTILLENAAIQKRTKGVVLIDPDVLTRHSIQHYTGETEQYRKGWVDLEEYIRAGKYDTRIQEKVAEEHKHLEQLIPEKYSHLMDWDYYDAIELIRTTREYQIHKLLEASVYKDDLVAAEKQALSRDLPLVILDTDFESAYLKKIEDENVKASVAQWRKEGIEWYFDLAQASNCGAYWPVDTKEHLLMMTQPELIEQAVNKVMACSQ